MKTANCNYPAMRGRKALCSLDPGHEGEHGHMHLRWPTRPRIEKLSPVGRLALCQYLWRLRCDDNSTVFRTWEEASDYARGYYG